jgi:urease accessory protein
MTTLPLAQTLHRVGHWSGQSETVELDYDARFVRRKRLTTASGQPFVVDLEKTTSLDHGDALELDDGRYVEVIAAS